jgi:hypothetical protein
VAKAFVGPTERVVSLPPSCYLFWACGVKLQEIPEKGVEPLHIAWLCCAFHDNVPVLIKILKHCGVVRRKAWGRSKVQHLEFFVEGRA